MRLIHTAVFYFGEFVAASQQDFETYAFIKKLEILKKNLYSSNFNTNYFELNKVCSDFENEHRGLNLTNRILEHNFVTDEELEILVKENARDLSGLRIFLNKTYEDNLYKINGYGNLENVHLSDFEDIIDDIVNDLKNNIFIPTAKKEATL